MSDRYDRGSGLRISQEEKVRPEKHAVERSHENGIELLLTTSARHGIGQEVTESHT